MTEKAIDWDSYYPKEWSIGSIKQALIDAGASVDSAENDASAIFAELTKDKDFMLRQFRATIDRLLME
jgi:hypothetical protein